MSDFRNKLARGLDWLDHRSPVAFVAVLYAVRGVLILAALPLVYALAAAFPGPEADLGGRGSAFGLFLALIVVAPLGETLFECWLPYAILSRIRGCRERPRARRWGFVALSAGLMVLLHPIVSAIPPTLITGVFLAYCYAHFAPDSVARAIAATTLFHAAINIVGWTLIVVG